MDKNPSIETEAVTLMEQLIGIMGTEDYCIWLAQQVPPLDERQTIEIRAALKAKLSAVSE